VDPATLFDLVKIRRLVDDATDLAVRAANGTTSSALSNSHNATNGLFSGGSAAALGLGLGGGGANAKLSRERRHRMREHATQKLSHAYHLDEIAASVATMQSASALEEVAKHVLARNQNDPDATYVHFFHEKIPSRSLAECTSLAPLDEVIHQRPTEAALFRTRAVTRIFKEDFGGATTDLTEGLRACRLYNTQHQRRNEQMELVLARETAREVRTDTKVDEKHQPSSLEGQLLFHRAGTYLTMACDNIATALHGLPATNGGTPATNGHDAEEPRSLSKAEKEANHRRLEARKLVRTYAKRALRDYTAFISRFDYTPGQPSEITKNFLAKVNAAANGHGRRGQENRLLEMAEFPMTARSTALIKSSGQTPRHPRQSSQPTASKPIYPLNELFASVPPADLPPYPTESTALVKSIPNTIPTPPTDPDLSETLTYHPLLTDALHSLLLCHCLIQTPAKEHLRHAHMVARLVRISDGFPIFLAARSPARADWIEVIRRSGNWLGLSASWDVLCAPPPVAVEGPAGKGKGESSAEERREGRRREAIREALADERVVDEETFRASVRAREMRAAREEEEEIRLEYLRSKGVSPEKQGQHRDGGVDGAEKGGAQDEGAKEKEYPIMTERAEAIARWIREAPLPGEAGPKKGNGKKKEESLLRKSASNVSGSTLNGLENSVESLSIGATEE
jgi:hypothetical protein